MANKKYEETDIQAIADTIREKTGSEDSYKVSEMASGVNEVYEAGKTKEWSDFWDGITINGTRGLYTATFAHGWNDNMFDPKETLKPTNASEMFSSTKITKKITKSMVDFSNCTNFYRTFQSAPIEEIEEFNVSAATLFNDPFRHAHVKTIDKLIFNATGQTVTNTMFDNATNLKNIGACEGLIANSLKMSACPLTPESIKNIITCLKDYAGTADEYKYTVTFKATAFEALEAEGATAEYNGTACTWAELIDNLKWNLTLA